MSLEDFLDKEITQEALDKMQPAYWEKTWWRRLWVTVRWSWQVRQRYIEDGEAPAKR